MKEEEAMPLGYRALPSKHLQHNLARAQRLSGKTAEAAGKVKLFKRTCLWLPFFASCNQTLCHRARAFLVRVACS